MGIAEFEDSRRRAFQLLYFCSLELWKLVYAAQKV
jgi:hypothetical protein